MHQPRNALSSPSQEGSGHLPILRFYLLPTKLQKLKLSECSTSTWTPSKRRCLRAGQDFLGGVKVWLAVTYCVTSGKPLPL